MTSLFVSHSSRDRVPTERVRDWLRAEGYVALFVDFDPDDGIRAGRDWERELYAQLRKCDGVVFLASAASTTSRWCFAEVSLARALGKAVIPVRVEPGARLNLLDDVQWIDLADGDHALSRLRHGLLAAGLDPVESFAWDPNRAPYPGLRPFEADDAAVFFGRGPEVGRLLELLQPTLQRGTGRFVGIVGPSGSGKSSLMRAGLLPRMARLNQRWVILPPLRPGSNPRQQLAACLADSFGVHGGMYTRVDLATRLEQGPKALFDLAVELAELNGSPGSERPKVLVVIDQAEELLTLSGPREQEAFLQLLAGAVTRERLPVVGRRDGPLGVSLDRSRAGRTLRGDERLTGGGTAQPVTAVPKSLQGLRNVPAWISSPGSSNELRRTRSRATRCRYWLTRSGCFTSVLGRWQDRRQRLRGCRRRRRRPDETRRPDPRRINPARAWLQGPTRLAQTRVGGAAR